MRYIGNKTKLLSFIHQFLLKKGIVSGRALDAFSGTASVGSYLKSVGFEVDSCDLMYFSFVLQNAYTVVDRMPQFGALRSESLEDVLARKSFNAIVEERFPRQGDLFTALDQSDRRLAAVLTYLDSFLPVRRSFVTSEYSSADASHELSRMYFTEGNGLRIDAVRHELEDWYKTNQISQEEYYVCLASLLEAADQVANTTGVYAAFVKAWQPNALKALRLRIPEMVLDTGLTCRAFHGDINSEIAHLGSHELLYLDPPYNTRQYSGYYHVPELIALGWFGDPVALRGKTGLIPNEHTKSEWSTREGCVRALDDLLGSARARHVLMSYSSEGIIPAAEIERLFRKHGRAETFEIAGLDYQRYKADMNSESRQYKADRVTEFLYYVQMN